MNTSPRVKIFNLYIYIYIHTQNSNQILYIELQTNLINFVLYINYKIVYMRESKQVFVNFLGQGISPRDRVSCPEAEGKDKIVSWTVETLNKF